MEIPNLAGVATKDLVEQIGSGSFKASYINWSRTMNLLRTHAPGWTASCITDASGSLLHKAPVGAYLMIQFVHTDGSETPAIPQAVMDHRNNAIPYEKISARDITDTQRRGTCMAAAFIFGLAYELWAKMPLESGYGDSAPNSAPKSAPEPARAIKKVPKAIGSTDEVNPAEHFPEDYQEKASGELPFIQACEKAGLTQNATKFLLGKIKNDYSKGMKTLAIKVQQEGWVQEQNQNHPD